MMLEQLDNNKCLLKDILAESLVELPKQLNELRAYFESSDMGSIHRQAHTMKGTASYLGASALREICFNIETSAKDDNELYARELFSELEKVFILTIEALNNA
jgi:HPt (histidine-containing phosphotransfer) domain-containing protein